MKSFCLTTLRAFSDVCDEGEWSEPQVDIDIGTKKTSLFGVRFYFDQ